MLQVPVLAHAADLTHAQIFAGLHIDGLVRSPVELIAPSVFAF